MYKLETTTTFRKDFKRLSQEIKIRFSKAYNRLSVDPFNLRKELRIKKLQGNRSIFALRIGSYRTFYQIEGKTIILEAVEHRQSAYKK